METESDTLLLQGNITLKCIFEVIADVNYRIENMKERLASLEDKLSGTEEVGHPFK